MHVFAALAKYDEYNDLLFDKSWYLEDIEHFASEISGSDKLFKNS